MRHAALLPAALAALLWTAPAAAAGRADAAACRPASGRGTQLVTVDAASAGSTVGTLRLWRRSGRCWVRIAGPWRARLGRNGVSAHHREGDGTTPLGTYAFAPVAYGVAADPGVRLRYHRLVCGDWWDEDPASAAYNRFRHVRCGTKPPFGAGSEALWTETTAYRYFAVIAYNTARMPGRGSAIFLHADTGRATNGCVSLPVAELRRTLRWLDPRRRPRIAIAVRA
jgi:L,D-peptidoglycan transpeptidase YkuD (ErfK/YbiS/YcfS/YnhG family)